jgi:hypothetical protein
MAMDPYIQDTAVLRIFHPNLHERNILVSEEDPTVVAAMIDWQLSSIETAFWYADELREYARPVPDSFNEDRTEPKSEACAQAFNACI